MVNCLKASQPAFAGGDFCLSNRDELRMRKGLKHLLDSKLMVSGPVSNDKDSES